MEHHNEKNTPSRKSPAKRSKALNSYIITIAINFFLFTFYTLTQVWTDIADHYLPWESRNVILIWLLLLGTLVASFFRLEFGLWYLFTNLLTIIAFFLPNYIFWVNIIFLFSFASVMVSYIILVREKVYYY